MEDGKIIGSGSKRIFFRALLARWLLIYAAAAAAVPCCIVRKLFILSPSQSVISCHVPLENNGNNVMTILHVDNSSLRCC